mmetsp:Transcript_29871/g.95229  ORF Transcript_29871/g.95229 Transcript_29871/m.95229 type:complete len:367 (-) Transcript_29871:41-1141(-)
MSYHPPASTQSLPYSMQPPPGRPEGYPMGPAGPPPPMMGPPPQGGGYVKRFVSPKNVFIGTGILLLAMLCVVPIWNAVALMQDNNYVFWVGTSVPTWMVCLCAGIVALYVVTIFVFFSTARPQVQTEQTIMMIANIFITLLGLVLMLLSLPLSRQSVDTYNNLMHRCDYSEQTHRMYEYSQVLHNIRRLPECASKYSVEECQGYEDAPPYTNFLKSMESDFRCSGFCYRPPGAVMGAAFGRTAPAAAQAGMPSSLIHKGRRRHQDHVMPLALPSIDGRGLAAQPPTAVQQTVQYPPTLFSDANYQASCEGMAARDMKNFAGDVGFQTFYQGIYLVLIAVATGFLKLIGFCVRRDRDADFKIPQRGY